MLDKIILFSIKNKAICRIHDPYAYFLGRMECYKAPH